MCGLQAADGRWAYVPYAAAHPAGAGAPPTPRLEAPEPSLQLADDRGSAAVVVVHDAGAKALVLQQ